MFGMMVAQQLRQLGLRVACTLPKIRPPLRSELVTLFVQDQ